MITSVSNDKIKEIIKLKDNKNMMQEKKFIVETMHLVEEAKKCGVLLETISLNDINLGVKNTVVSSNVMAKLSDLKTPSNVIGICKFLDESDDLSDKVLILDGVGDPGNLGTIIRSANAFGIKDIVLSKTSVNKYNSKVIRATEGMMFNLNVISRDLNEYIKELKNSGYKILVTDVTGGSDIRNINKDEKLAIVMGSEGSGVSDEIKKLSDENIYIKTSDSCESLNVAVATSIILYELAK